MNKRCASGACRVKVKKIVDATKITNVVETYKRDGDLIREGLR